MAQQRKKASPAAKKTAAAAPLLNTALADPAPFFALGAAHFADAIVVTKVVSVVLPLRHLRDKTILHEMVLKKLLHRAFEPSAEDLAQQEQHPEAAPSPSTASSSSTASPDLYVIVHIKSVEIHADTARQVNPQGDVQVNVMTTLVATRVRHGLVAGVAEASAFATCMQVRLPSVAVSAAVAACDESSANATDGFPLESATATDDGDEAVGDAASAAGVPVARQLRVTARCLEDEPVAPGQAVLLVSEPAAMRCLAIRPPRDAPGPFFFAEDTTVNASGAAAKPVKRRRTATKSSGGDEAAAVPQSESRRVVVVACDIPEGEGGSEKKRARF